MDELLSEFLMKADAVLDRLANDVLLLEEDPNDGDVLRRIINEIHTIKAASRFMSLARLEAISDAAETLLVGFQDGETSFNSVVTAKILEAFDAIESLVMTLKETEKEPYGDDAELVDCLLAMSRGETVPAMESVTSGPPSNESILPEAHEIDAPDATPDIQKEGVPSHHAPNREFNDIYGALSAGVEKLGSRMEEAHARRSEKFQMLESVLEKLSGALAGRQDEITCLRERFDHLKQTNGELSKLIKKLLDLAEPEIRDEGDKTLHRINMMASSMASHRHS